MCQSHESKQQQQLQQQQATHETGLKSVFNVLLTVQQM